MAKTRAKKAATGPSESKLSSSNDTEQEQILQTYSKRQILILPSKATPEAKVVTLPHPRHSRLSRYLVCPEAGLFEFTRVIAPKGNPRSWFLEADGKVDAAQSNPEASDFEAQVVAGAELHIATPIDPLFLLLPALSQSQNIKGSDETKRMFLTSDDYFDKMPAEHSHLNHILSWPKIRALLDSRMSVICDTLEVGDESMFRLNEIKLFQVILRKAQNLCRVGLPPSLEEKFVVKALDAPILIQKRNVPQATPPEIITDAEEVVRTNEDDSQSSTAISGGSTPLCSTTSTAATSFVEVPSAEERIERAMVADDQIIRLQRLKVAFNFICSSYLVPAVADQLIATLKKEKVSSIDFSALDAYHEKLVKLRAEALIAHSMVDYSSKRGRDEEDDFAQQEKRRKLEEEKKRKASESRGVRDLKKVNTAGMMKLSHFFKKK